MGTPDFESGLAAALFDRVQQRVLALFFGQADRDFSTRDVIRLAGSGTGAVQRQLRRLAKAGLITSSRLGNQTRYRANIYSPIFEELRGLVLKTVGLVWPLREALSIYREQIAVAFVYGSVAMGDDTSASDIDLMVLGRDMTYADLYSALTDAERKLARTINPTLSSISEWREKLANENAFAARVNGRPKIFVIGSEDDLRSA